MPAINTSGPSDDSEQVNTTGILGLPVELFDMVISHLGNFAGQDPSLLPSPQQIAERVHNLIALSQTSRTLRRVLCPCGAGARGILYSSRQWRKFVHRTTNSTFVSITSWYEILAEKLERISKKLIIVPSTARCIRYEVSYLYFSCQT